MSSRRDSSAPRRAACGGGGGAGGGHTPPQKEETRMKRGVVLTLILALVMLAPLAGRAQRPLEGTTLRVATWGGSWTDPLHTPISTRLESMGAKVGSVLANPTPTSPSPLAPRRR